MDTAQGTTPVEIKIYDTSQGRIGRWKDPETGAWKNKRIPSDVPDPKGWMAAWVADNVGTATPQPKGHTLRKLVPRWETYRIDQQGTDPRKVKPTCRCILRWGGEVLDIPLDKLTVGKVAAWVDTVLKSGVAPYTARNIVQAHRSLLVDARGMGWVDLKENVFADPYIRNKLSGAAPKAGKDVIVALDKEQTLKLLSSGSPLISDERKVLNLVALCTGMRFGELAGLSWSCIKDDGTVQVFRQLDVGGHKPTFKPPKKGSRRVLPLHPLAQRALAWWKQRTKVAGDDDPVFPGRFGFYGHISKASRFREDLAAAGVSIALDAGDGLLVPYTFHSLRRTCMSLLEEQGVPRELIGGLAGHGARGVTDRHYIRKSIKRYREAVAALPLPATLRWLREQAARKPKAA